MPNVNIAQPERSHVVPGPSTKGPLSDSGFETGPAKLRPNLARKGFSNRSKQFWRAPVLTLGVAEWALIISKLAETFVPRETYQGKRKRCEEKVAL